MLLLLGNVLRADLVALMLMLALGLSGILTPQEAFSGFGRSAVIIMMSAFILAEGLRRSGMTERLGSFIIKLFGKGERQLIFGVMAASAMLSLFMNNIAAASLLFPSLSGVARQSKISPSKLLMPLAFGTILGGMGTLLTTTNIVASGLLRDAKLPGFTLTEFCSHRSSIDSGRNSLYGVMGKKVITRINPWRNATEEMRNQVKQC